MGRERERFIFELSGTSRSDVVDIKLIQGGDLQEIKFKEHENSWKPRTITNYQTWWNENPNNKRGVKRVDSSPRKGLAGPLWQRPHLSEFIEVDFHPSEDGEHSCQNQLVWLAEQSNKQGCINQRELTQGKPTQWSEVENLLRVSYKISKNSPQESSGLSKLHS